jgi:Cdc6-like AAA superfamily ATPase
MDVEEKLRTISAYLSPEHPIRSQEFLRGRTEDLDAVVRELRFFHAIPFIYGYRGVGKTSLARTAAQLVAASDREHIYRACAPKVRVTQTFREIAEELLTLIFRSGMALKKVEWKLSLSPSIKASFERNEPKIEPFDNVSTAVRVLRELDSLLPDAKSTVVILDELEALAKDDRSDLAYMIKQFGDQEFKLKFVLVGIAQNVHELIGSHPSVPRYLKEVSLKPLIPQSLMDIVESASNEVGVTVPRNILMRIAIIGNGFPHFAHLMGKELLIAASESGVSRVTDEVYKKGVREAVAGSKEELRIVYDTATQRRDDYYKHLIWAMAHSDVVDIRIDEWLSLYRELSARNRWRAADDKPLKNAIRNFAKESYGEIIVNTPAHYGSQETRYRYKRFREMLMRGQVRLIAENEGTILGREPGL